MKIFAKTIEDGVKGMAQEFEDLGLGKDIALMPDTHIGKGVPIGFTAHMTDKVSPNTIGVDIGCGMLLTEIGEVEIDFDKLDNVIMEHIPFGRNIRNESYVDNDTWNNMTKGLKVEIRNLRQKEGYYKRSVGTLGGGNHFIEIVVLELGRKYLVVHTGSRAFGANIADHYQRQAYTSLTKFNTVERDELIERYKEAGKANQIQEALKGLKKQDIPTSLTKENAWLIGSELENYINDMKIAQEFAKENRRLIAKDIIKRMDWNISDNALIIDSPHNNIGEDNIIRKGATSAKLGEKLLIPIDMKFGTIVAEGKGNPDWNNSAPHGAGRVMSRTKAKEVLNLEDVKKENNE